MFTATGLHKAMSSFVRQFELMSIPTAGFVAAGDLVLDHRLLITSAVATWVGAQFVVFLLRWYGFHDSG